MRRHCRAKTCCRRKTLRYRLLGPPGAIQSGREVRDMTEVAMSTTTPCRRMTSLRKDVRQRKDDSLLRYSTCSQCVQSRAFLPLAVPMQTRVS